MWIINPDLSQSWIKCSNIGVAVGCCNCCTCCDLWVFELGVATFKHRSTQTGAPAWSLTYWYWYRCTYMPTYLRVHTINVGSHQYQLKMATANSFCSATLLYFSLLFQKLFHAFFWTISMRSEWPFPWWSGQPCEQQDLCVRPPRAYWIARAPAARPKICWRWECTFDPTRNKAKNGNISGKILVPSQMKRWWCFARSEK